MSREDRRPLSQVPEDSVNTYMHPFSSQYAQGQESFTLYPPYNLPDQNISDTFAYFPNDADTFLAGATTPPLPPHWAHNQPTDIPSANRLYPYPAIHFSELPLQTPIPLLAQPSLPASAQIADHEDTFWYDPTTDTSDVNAILQSLGGELPNGVVPNSEYHSEFSAFPATPPPNAGMKVSDLSDTPRASGTAPPHGRSLGRSKNRAARLARPITPRASGFVPSDPDELSAHEKKRHYLVCLESYVKYLHDLFESIQVQPLPLERVSSYRGLTSRSMRTILVQLGKSADIIHERTIQEEDKFCDLRDTLCELEAAADYTPILESLDYSASSPTHTYVDPHQAELLKFLANASA
ncbi:hypothetical protein B0H10DRAFT_2225348 [Mycena sp. CBHHK59/15]|nr:hypothetical protein B0H10DRAFT_2225348 [Mycena sp. CBHHK59/15]